VFRAYDPERERLVAIKLFKLDLPPERVHQLVGAFERLVAADLTHPTLLAPRAAGIADVAAYLVQDYIGAESLDLTVREHGAAPPAYVLRVAVQLADALDCAASVNIFHGALHPRDVMLSSDDTRLTGVGVARALEQVGVTAPVRRPYSAPERMAGAFWDRRADVFSLAALLHDLLWARRVSALGADAGAALTPLEGGDAAALRTVFARALAENPEERFATAREFAEVLTRAFPGVSADSAPVAVAQPAKRGSRMELEPRLPLSVSENKARDAVSEDKALSIFEDESITPSAERYEDVDLDTVADERRVSVEVEEEPVAGPVGLITGHDANALTPLDRARSAVWPLVLALTVGLAMGFAGGYGVGSHDRTPAAVSAGREFTESAVADTPKKDAETARGVERAEAPAAVAAPAKESSAPVRPAPAPTASTGRTPDTTPAATAAAPSATESGRLLIRSTPDGASVSVDGHDYGKTPATVRDLARGPHQVRVTRDGYAAQERRVVISSSRPSQSVNVTMVPTTPAPPPSRSAAAAPAPQAGRPTSGRATGALAVDSRPTGARVFLDGKPIGTTPLMVPSVAPGDHAIRLELDGYRPWASSVRMVAAESNRVTASLER
jgi:serine/threonine-protein kinase